MYREFARKETGIVFQITPYPGFSWSISRQRLFDRCPRAYYFRYYLSHNGWLRDAAEPARMAYRLSKLTTLDALLGLEVDRRARELEAQARQGRLLATAEELEELTRVELRRAWRSSRDSTAFEASPKSVTMLRSFYLEDGPPSDRDIERLNGKIPAAMRRLVALEHWERLRACGGDGCVLIPEFAHLFHRGVKVFAAADLAYVHEDRLHVIDWKTGRPGEDETFQVQLSAFGLIAADQALAGEVGDAGLRVEAVLEYLCQGESVAVQLAADWPEAALQTVELGVTAMRTYLRDPESNAPLEEQEFPRRDSGSCRYCDYVRLCERE